MTEWMITAAAHAVLVIAYACIAWIVAKGLLQARQWRGNELAVASFGIFASCALGHGVHLLHALEHAAGLDSAVTSAAIVQFSDPVLLVWSAATALVASSYLFLRRHLRLVVHGGAVCEDLAAREDEARRLREPIKDAIALAQKRLMRGDSEGAQQALQVALWQGRESITILIEPPEPKPGSLRRPA